ncbi:MAG: type II toxin-antitoxin system PemK/MazF family toxin [Verrucomicrobia bacterium]|nr:type II toxin-antitoxin system PemK/MazF family toxin [Verrucomicrobiota bacterium]
MNAPTVRRGEVVLVCFPFSDLSSNAVRPALVLSSDGHNASDPDVVCLMISSQARKARTSDFVLHQADADFRQSGLQVDSVFRICRLAALDRGLLRRRLGKASDRILEEVATRLLELLQLTPAP